MAACTKKTEQSESSVMRIGFIKSPFLTSVFEAETKNDKSLKIEPVIFGNDEDSGYALIAGKIDAAFIEPDRAFKLIEGSVKKEFKIAGVIEFPYGATLIVRKDHTIRLNEIERLTVAAEDEDCVLFQHFISDLKKYDIDPEKINFIFMEFSDMIPALEAKTVDAVLSKASYSAVAESLGHKTLYQNWNIPVGGDDCCPLHLAKTELFLVVGKTAERNLGELLKRLSESSAISEASVKYLSIQVGYPEEALKEFIPATFVPVSKELAENLGKDICITKT